MQRTTLGGAGNTDKDVESDTGMGRQSKKGEFVHSYQGEQLELNLGETGK